MNLPKQTADLLEAYFAGDPAPEVIAAMEAWLREDEANARLLAEYGLVDRLISHEQKNQDASAIFAALLEAEEKAELVVLDTKPALMHDVEENPDDAIPFSKAMSVLSYAAKQSLYKHAIAVTGIAAAIVFAAILTILFISGPNLSGNQTATNNTPSTNALIPVATLTTQRDAQWQVTSSPFSPSVGDQLMLGQRLTLIDGFAEITTHRGAVAVLEAPVSIEIIDHQTLRLHRGKLVGICETVSSKNFVVRTPQMDITDLGTRFGIDVTTEISSVLVMDGAVLTRPPAKSPNAFEPLVMKESDACRVWADTNKLERIAASEAPVFFSAIPSLYEQVVTESRPVLWMRQNEQDPSNLLGSAAFGVTKPGFGSVGLDGRGCVDAGDVLDFDADEPFSVGIWIRPGGDHNDMFVLGRAAKNIERGIHGYDLYLSNQRLRVQLLHAFDAKDSVNSLIRVESEKPLDTDRWHHVVATYDGSREASGVKIYINGVPIPTNVLDDSLDRNNIHAKSPFRIGLRGFAQPQSNIVLDGATRDFIVEKGSPMIGEAGDLVVFDRILRESEIKSFYDESSSFYSTPKLLR